LLLHGHLCARVSRAVCWPLGRVVEIDFPVAYGEPVTADEREGPE